LDWLLRHKDHEGDDCLIFPYSIDHNGYGRAKLDGKQITASRMMCFIVLGDPESDDHQAAHSCGKGHEGCVHPKHLRWDTCSGNHADKVTHGTAMRGTACHAHKLDEALVRELRSLQGTISQREIAERFGIAQTTVSRILRRVTWGWVGNDRIVRGTDRRVG
jgi:predicted XRE-type DNA-binding protein